MSYRLPRALVFASLLAIPVSMPLTQAGAAASASPKTMTLKQSDLPKGFTLASAKTSDNKTAAKDEHVSVATLNSKGRITGYQVIFQRKVKSGVFELLSAVVQYKSASGSHWDYARSNTQFRKDLGSSAHVSSISNVRVGDESVGYSATGPTVGKGLTAVFLALRHGNYDGGIVAIGRTGTFKSQSLVHDLQVMNSRM